MVSLLTSECYDIDKYFVLAAFRGETLWHFRSQTPFYFININKGSRDNDKGYKMLNLIRIWQFDHFLFMRSQLRLFQPDLPATKVNIIQLFYNIDRSENRFHSWYIKVFVNLRHFRDLIQHPRPHPQNVHLN